MATAMLRQSDGQVRSEPSVHRFSVAEYHRMIQMGILTEDHRVELWEGVIVNKMAHNPPHDGTITRVQRHLTRLLSDQWLIRVQCAITLRTSEPEPDLAIVKGPEEIYFARHPIPSDIALLIEVADSSLENDRREKVRMYAGARIPLYWIINLNERHIEVYTEPKGGKKPLYRQRTDYDVNANVPLIIANEEIAHIATQDLLPPQTGNGKKR